MNSLSMSMLETQKNILRNILNILKMKKESNKFFFLLLDIFQILKLLIRFF